MHGQHLALMGFNLDKYLHKPSSAHITCIQSVMGKYIIEVDLTKLNFPNINLQNRGIPIPYFLENLIIIFLLLATSMQIILIALAW